MKFIANGPDVPEKLIREHEEGNVVFFCGAGISIPAGMPSFEALVNELCEKFGEECPPGPPDQILDRLEHTKARNFRPSLYEFLKIKRNAIVDTHIALTKLATDSRDNSIRLVTTNFDHLFEKAYKTLKRKHEFYAAPVLPPPKKSKWDGIVYLHGLLPSIKKEKDLSKLVITSGDFGLAYLTEMWASRFVSELFRNFSVCFVGYSLSDPVMRYMTDAISADRMYGEKLPDLWAFVSEDKNSSETLENWRARGIQPILYSHLNNHQALHETLKVWANLHMDGANGKEMIIAKYAGLDPLEKTPDDFVGRVLWALADPSCKPAKRFSEMEPIPSLNWLLGPFTQQQNLQGDDEGNFFSSCITVKQNLSPFVQLDLDPVPRNPQPIYLIIQWTLKYINDKKLILWLLEQGPRLSHFYKFQILEKLDELSQSQNGSKLLSDDMKRWWQLFIADALMLRGRNFYDFYSWVNFFSKNQCQPTFAVRSELRKVLAPKIIINRGVLTTKEFNFELGLASDDVRSSLENFDWSGVLSSFIEDFQILLKDALAMAKGIVDFDLSFDLPSIEKHPQNQFAPDYTVLVELLRDSWLDLFQKKKCQARMLAAQWLEEEEIYFKRLGLFAASLDDAVDAKVWVLCLLKNSADNLWDAHLQREILRLFVKQGKNIPKDLVDDLVSMILGRAKDVDVKQEWVDHKKWLYLSKLQSSGVYLGNQADSFLSLMRTEHPDWMLSESDEDEFLAWFGDIKELSTKTLITPMPKNESEIRDWLMKVHHPENDPLWEIRFLNQWREICLRYPLKSIRAVKVISPLKGERELHIWRSLFQVVSNRISLTRLWKLFSKAVAQLPIEYMEVLSNEISWWMYETSQKTHENQDDYFLISAKLLSLKNSSTQEKGMDLFTRAINDSSGRVVLTLMNILFSESPQAGQGLHGQLKPLFTDICDRTREELRSARTVLASRLISLFRIDQQWTQENLLPLFSWKNIEEASVVWQGSACHFESLGRHAGNYATLVAYIALEKVQDFSKAELRGVLKKMPKDGLNRVARLLYQALGSASNKKSYYWKNRVKPILKDLWPNDKDRVSPSLSTMLTYIAIASDKCFPDAVGIVINLLQPVTDVSFSLICKEILEKRCAENYPKHTLVLLNKICPTRWELSIAKNRFKDCLSAVAKADSEIVKDVHYKKLNDLVGV